MPAEAEGVPAEPAPEPTPDEPEAGEEQVVEDTTTAAAAENVPEEEPQTQAAEAEVAAEETVPLPDATEEGESASAPACPLGKALGEDGTCG